MTYTIFTGGRLRELAAARQENKLFRSLTERFWLNLVTKDHAAPVAEMHEHEADLYLVVEGEGRLYLGGTLVDPTSPEPGQQRGSGLAGAACHTVHAGDVVIIPEGAPHMVDARESRLVYLVVKMAHS